MKTTLRVTGILGLGLLVAGCALFAGGKKAEPAPEPAAAPAPATIEETTPEQAKTPPPAATPEEVQLTVFAMGDLHGQLEVQEVDKRAIGGAGWIAGYLSAVRATNPGGVIAVDTGDAFTGPLHVSHSEGASVIEFFNLIGLDAMAIGNHEFDFGPVGPLNRTVTKDADPRGALKERAKEAKFPLLTANIYEGEARFAPEGILPYTIIERLGVKIALIGVCTEKLPVLTLPYNLTGLTYKRHADELAKILPEVREKGATVIVVIGHLGAEYDGDAEQHLGELADLANELNPGDVDLIVGGHTKGDFATVLNGIPVVKPPDYGKGFSRVDLYVDKATGKVKRGQTKIAGQIELWHDDVDEAGKSKGPATYDTKQIAPLKAADTILVKYLNAVERLKETGVGEAITDITRLGTYNSALGNIVTDAMRLVAENVDVALFNGGGLRADLPVGSLTFNDLFSVMPFDNTITLVRLSGDQLKAALEHGLTGQFGTLEVSGLKVTIDPAQSIGSRVLRVHNADGKEITTADTVTVAINDFMLAGGDEYNMFPRSTAVETNADIRELIVKLIDLRGKTLMPDLKPRYVVFVPEPPESEKKKGKKKGKKKVKKAKKAKAEKKAAPAKK